MYTIHLRNIYFTLSEIPVVWDLLDNWYTMYMYINVWDFQMHVTGILYTFYGDFTFFIHSIWDFWIIFIQYQTFLYIIWHPFAVIFLHTECSFPVPAYNCISGLLSPQRNLVQSWLTPSSTGKKRRNFLNDHWKHNFPKYCIKFTTCWSDYRYVCPFNILVFFSD